LQQSSNWTCYRPRSLTNEIQGLPGIFSVMFICFKGPFLSSTTFNGFRNENKLKDLHGLVVTVKHLWP